MLRTGNSLALELRSDITELSDRIGVPEDRCETEVDTPDTRVVVTALTVEMAGVCRKVVGIIVIPVPVALVAPIPLEMYDDCI